MSLGKRGKGRLTIATRIKASPNRVYDHSSYSKNSTNTHCIRQRSPSIGHPPSTEEKEAL